MKTKLQHLFQLGRNNIKAYKIMKILFGKNSIGSGGLLLLLR